MSRLSSIAAEAALLLGLLVPAPALAVSDDDPAPESAPEIAPAPPRPASPFAQGKTRIGLSGGGYGRSGEVDFYVAGAFGYFVLDNLEVGADLAIWFGDTPTTLQIGPAVRYVIPLDGPIQPYLGAFYRHWFVSGTDPDADTVGARAGVLIHSDHLWFTVGAAYEAVVSDCDGDCGDFYPEFGFAFLL